MAGTKVSQADSAVYVICGKDKFLAGSECEALLNRGLIHFQRGGYQKAKRV